MKYIHFHFIYNMEEVLREIKGELDDNIYNFSQKLLVPLFKNKTLFPQVGSTEEGGIEIYVENKICVDISPNGRVLLVDFTTNIIDDNFQYHYINPSVVEPMDETILSFIVEKMIPFLEK